MPGEGTSDGANAGESADKDAAGEETGGEGSAGEEGTDDASRGGGAADADTPTLTPRPIHLADTGSSTRLSALLTPPFDQLASPGLHAAAHTHYLQHLAQPDKPTTPPTADGALMTSTTRTTPTLVGERRSSSGTASQPVSTGVGSGKSLLVREKGFEPSRPKAPGPKPGASTNSATRAVSCLLYRLLCRWQNPKASRTRSGRQGLGAGEPEGASPGMRSVHTKRGKQPLDMPGGTDVVLGQRHSPVGCHHHG